MRISHLGRIFIGAFFPILAWAAPANDQTIDELFRVTRVEKMAETFQNQMLQMHQKLLADLGKQGTKYQSPAFKKDFDALFERFRQEHLSFAKFKPLISQTYKNEFSEEELQDLIRFYHSPVGQKALDVAPKMSAALMAAVNKELVSSMPEFQNQLKELTKKYSH